MLIEYHIGRGDLDTAQALIREGQDKLARPGGYLHGIALHYQKYLLEIAQSRGDTKVVIDQARALWLGRAGHGYYDILKGAIPAAEWPAYRDALLSDKACNVELVTWASAQEGLWAKVRDMVLANRYLLPSYQLEIEKRFPDEVAEAYVNFARQIMEKAANRDKYREAAAFLIRMRLLGHEEAGKAAATTFPKPYLVPEAHP